MKTLVGFSSESRGKSSPAKIRRNLKSQGISDINSREIDDIMTDKATTKNDSEISRGCLGTKILCGLVPASLHVEN